MRVLSRLLLLFLVTLVAGGELRAQPARGKTRKLRVVVDASHDGGAWWFPQGPAPFDPDKWHQGSELAAYLKGRGWDVVEVPRGERISDELAGASIVVRMNLFGAYSSDEVIAYRDFVWKGGRLLLVSGFVRENEQPNDSVAAEFGVRFEGMVENGLMRSAEAHGSDLDGLYRIGSVVTQYPKSTRPLAYLDNDRLVMGTFRFGKGRIVFISSVFPILHVRQKFTTGVFNELMKGPPKRRRK